MFATLRPRITAAGAVLALAASAVSLGSAPANAAELGKIALSPASGKADIVVTAGTQGLCPADTDSWDLQMTGPGIPVGSGLINGGSPYSSVNPQRNGSNDGYAVQFARHFSDVFLENDVKQPSGTYTVWLQCYDALGMPYGEFNAAVDFTPTATNYVPTYSQAAGQATSTTLEAGPVDPIAAGTVSTLTASVVPSAAAGQVQFLRAGVAIGSPVTVSGGAATYEGALPAGAADLTAEFTPTSPADYAPSTSAAVSYLVMAAPAITGTPKVGASLTCAGTTGGTQAWAWLKSGTPVSGFTTKTVKVPSTWLNASVACRVTTTKGDHQLVQTSVARKIALGSPLKNTVKPAILGTPKVGKKLTCTKGSWTPTATSYGYAWLRDGKVLAGKTLSTYLVVTADRRHNLSCRVTARKAGYANGVATSVARKIG